MFAGFLDPGYTGIVPQAGLDRNDTAGMCPPLVILDRILADVSCSDFDPPKRHSPKRRNNQQDLQNHAAVVSTGKWDRKTLCDFDAYVWNQWTAYHRRLCVCYW